MAKKLVVLGTGGTIAGTAAQASDNVGYTAAQLGVAQLLQAVGGLQGALRGQDLVSEQVAQVDSKDMDWAQWAALAQRVQLHLEDAQVSAVVITHGTDTVEETAFFLASVLPAALLQAKPVVLTCAMRPASSQNADGPQNLLDAVAVASDAQASGVLVVCAGVVHSARDVQKVHSYRLNAFDSGDAGALGYVEEGAVRWVHACAERAVTPVALRLEAWPAPTWPRVEILMNYAGARGASVQALCTQDGAPGAAVRGIVLAGTGNGSLHHSLEQALVAVQARGVRVVRSTRCAYGSLVGSVAGAFPASALSPVKARIARMLELMA